MAPAARVEARLSASIFIEGRLRPSLVASGIDPHVWPAAYRVAVAGEPLSGASRVGFPGAPASAAEREVVGAQLGRDPRGEVAIAARCPFALPMVVRTSPRLADGSPFPTLYYLTCPVAVRAVGRLEAAGVMRELEARLHAEPELREAYEAAHARFLEQRDTLAVLEDRSTAGGMPSRVKCLHALYAHELADGNPIGRVVAELVADDTCPGPCVVGAPDGGMQPTPGHPGFKGKKRRR